MPKYNSSAAYNSPTTEELSCILTQLVQIWCI